MKKIKFLLLAFIASSFIFIGCTASQQQYALQSSMLAVETQILEKQYIQVEKLLRAKQTESNVFTDDEWRKLLNVDATIDMLMTRYEAIQNADVASINLQDIMFMWKLTQEGYSQAREVVEGHFAEFNPSTQVLLQVFDQQAAATNARIDQLLSNPSNANINQSIVLIAGALGLAVKVVGIGAALI